MAAHAAEARAAIGAIAQQMRATLAGSGDIKAWTREYPWASLGIAAAAGFLAAKAVLPSPNGDKSDPLLARIMADEQISERLQQLVQQEEPSRFWPSLNSLMSGLFKHFGTAMSSALAAGLTAQATESEDGHAAPVDETTTADPVI